MPAQYLYRFTAHDPASGVTHQNTVPADSMSEAVAILERNAAITTGLPVDRWIVQQIDPNTYTA